MTEIIINIASASALWDKSFPRLKQKITTAAQAAVKASKKPASISRRNLEINILLTTDSEVRKLNRDFRGIDKPTNVLSFPQISLPPPPDKGRAATVPLPRAESLCLGDIVLAAQTVRRECKAEDKTLENHTLHLVIHGVLHLFGYDHLRQKDAKSMEKLECDILAALGYDNPYAPSPTRHSSTATGSNGRRAQ